MIIKIGHKINIKLRKSKFEMADSEEYEYEDEGAVVSNQVYNTALDVD